MRALTFQNEREVAVETVDDPRLETALDAIVRVQLCAVCGSDLHVYHGREQGMDPHCVMGHEFLGEVVEVGADVRQLKPGQRASQAEYVRVPLADSTLVPLTDQLDDREALLLGDVLSTGYFCAEQASIQKGGCWVVVGCGPVALCSILAARELGAERIFAIDRVPDRLALATAFGADALNFETQDLRAEILEATQGRGADAVLEGVGNSAAHRTALELLRPGGVLSVVGVHNEPLFSFSPTEAYDKNLTYRVGRCPARRLAGELAPFAARQSSSLRQLWTHEMPLEDAAKAYSIFDEKRDGCIKVALKP
jgi:threonine dehydrogenase-like Zn-dependent dehydrogenase